MILLCLVMSGCGTTMQNIADTSNPADQNNQTKSLAEAVKPIDTPDECMNWLYSNIRYQADESDEEFSPPEVTYQRKSGDCDDFAVMVVT